MYIETVTLARPKNEYTNIHLHMTYVLCLKYNYAVTKQTLQNKYRISGMMC